MPRHPDPALPARRRSQILEAARACFRHRGFRETTIEEICAEARISPGALYRYFDSKADIVAAIALDARAEAEAALDHLDNAEALLEGLADLARTFLGSFDGEADGALLADIWAEAARDPLLAKALRGRDAVVIRRLAAAIDRARASATVYPALDAAEAAEMLIAALEGFALRRTLAEEPLSRTVSRYRILALHLLKPKR